MGRLVLVLLGVLTVAALASTRAADPPSLKGTWVRETMVGPAMGSQVILTFTDHLVMARFRSGGRDPGGQEGWVTLEFEGEYARTDSGLLVGTITGMNVDLSKIPEGDYPGEPLGKSVAKMIGEPFCFRARVSDGALTVTDLKVPDVKIDDEHSSREMIAGFASGKYVSSPTENVPVPKLKAAKEVDFSRSKLASNITAFMWLMSRPRAMFSNQQESPVPEGVSQLPSLPMPNPVMMAPQPVLMPWAMPAPFALSSQPMPTAMPMPMQMPSTMPAPIAMAPQPMPMAIIPAKASPIQTLPTVRAEALMYQGFDSGPPGAVPLKVFPENIERIKGGIMDDANPVRETVIREIDMGEAGTMQVIVRMKGGNVKPMMPPPMPSMAPMRPCPPETTVCPTPGPFTPFPVLAPVPSTFIPTSEQLLPPGSMRNVPVMPAIADAWKASTAPVMK